MIAHCWVQFQNSGQGCDHIGICLHYQPKILKQIFFFKID